MNRIIAILLVALALVAPALVAPALAEEWPSRTVTIIVPFAAGSTPDSVARLLADRLQTRLGQNFIVENKPGASGNAGTGAVARAAPDGNTIGISIGGPLAINTLLFQSMPYDPFKDLAPVGPLVTQPSILVVSNELPVRTVQELIELLRKNPGRYNYASIGNGSLSHLAMEAIGMKSGTTSVHVPYTGSPQAVTALIRGDVQMAVLPAGAVVAQAAAGNIRMLGITSAKRSALLRDLPTLKESGIPDVEADAWNGVIAPARTDPAVIAKLNGSIQRILSEPELGEALKAQYMEPLLGSPQDLTARMKAELERWRPVIEAAGIKAR